MALPIGTKLGPYEIQLQLGAGGMGEVYRARDSRLDRVVAVKILAAHLSSSTELKQRMEREARTISSLNHPHICHLYDIGSQNGVDFLVMEFLEGETLAERLRKGPLPLHEILKIGIAIAEALAVAHRQGIVHRDLKPGNIMLTQAGAKLMDFGLAKPSGLTTASSTSGTGAPSFTAAPTLSGPSPLTPLTTAGTVIGTIQYMSPEQIEGKEADDRSDIFAFGAVLYEMATGKRPFQGKSQISLASAILEGDPEPISELQPLTPSAFQHVITTCLEKNPCDRYLAAHDIKLELQWIASEKTASEKPASDQPSPRSNLRAHILWAALAFIALILGAIGGTVLHREAPTPSIYTVIDAPEKTRVNLAGDAAGPPVLSPDGGTIAFTATGADGNKAIWARPTNSVQAHQLAGTDNAIFPFWSFDNRSLGFFAEGKLKVVDVSGGSAQIITDAPIGRGGAWGADGIIVFSPASTDRIYSVGANGGTPTPITNVDGTQHTSHRWPFFLPDGKHFLYLAINHTPSLAANDTIYYASVDGRENKPLFKAQSNAIYADGYLLFARNEQLLAQAFNPSSGALSGQPQTLVKGVINDPVTWHMDVTASNEGLLLYGSGGSGEIQLLWMDRATKQLSVVGESIADLDFANISPQGNRIALQIGARGNSNISVLDPASGIRTRLTFGPESNAVPVWSPDAKWIVYFSRRNGKVGLYRKLADGSGAEEELTSDDQLIVPTDWSRDGKYILYQRGTAGTQEIWALPLEGDRKPFLVVPTTPKTSRVGATLSPDGYWLTYMSNESGSTQTYVVAFKGGPGKWQVSAKGGYFPTWSHDGKELYYYVDSTNSIYAVPVKEVAGALQFGAPQTLANWSAPDPWYQVSPDGKKILLYRVSQQVSDSVTVVTNFSSILKK
jgi:serine/threonine protein kinase/Tol biopolymer transport system component